MINGYYLMGLNRDFNIDGADLKKKLEDYYVVIKDEVGAVVGCTSYKLTTSNTVPPPQDDGRE